MYTDFSNGKTILKTGSNFNVVKDYRRASNDVVATEFEVSVYDKPHSNHRYTEQLPKTRHISTALNTE
jgi:hypothetical protein